MSEMIVETAVITLREGVSEAELVAASNAFQTDFLNGRKGFLRRELLKQYGGGFLDLVHWESRAAADSVMEAAGDSEVCGSFFSLMETDRANPGEGVTHYRSLSVYEA